MLNSTIKDAQSQTWVKFLPNWALPYAQIARLDRPIGWRLLLIPCWWGVCLAAIAEKSALPKLSHMALFLVGAIVMRGAGCVINDLADHEIDAKVDRTKNRPLPSGRMSRREAWIFLSILMGIGLIVLLQFNRLTQVTALSSLIIVAAYPFMKRIMHLPQLVLGLAFNWGALLGWTSQTNNLSWPPILLYLGGIFWTLAYDTIYAHQDTADDALIGVKSTALLFGKNTLIWLVVFFILALGFITTALFAVSASPITYLGVIAASFHAIWQLRNFNAGDPAICLKLFRSNRIFGMLILLGMISAFFTL